LFRTEFFLLDFVPINYLGFYNFKVLPKRNKNHEILKNKIKNCYLIIGMKQDIIPWNVQNVARQWINPSKTQRLSTHVFAVIIK